MMLKAGLISVQYEEGFLRHISTNNEIVLSMIYFAVREPNWDTLPSRIENEHIDQRHDSFTITYQRHYENIIWDVTITGKNDSSIDFDIKGEALNDFETNRAGFCVLHPIEHCAGKEIRITHADKTQQLGAFPIYISPHQPFKDIIGMQWRPVPMQEASLYFEGDIFEMEDQRNWTDNSYKTYCTPLGLPSPARIAKGRQIHQHIQLTLKPANLPSIGIGRSDGNRTALEQLAHIGFSHYRVALNLDGKNWETMLEQFLEESKILNAPLELALNLGSQPLHRFLDAVTQPEQIGSIILPLHSLLYLPLLKSSLPNTLVGGGTNSHFTDLNRSNIDASHLDFVSYAIHPQVHAFDDTTITENAEAQKYTVETARERFNKPVHITPITLHDPAIADPRLHTAFGAEWTKRSLQTLTAAGAASLTYFEASGSKGLINVSSNTNPSSLTNVFEKFITSRSPI